MSSSTNKLPEGLVTSDVVQGHRASLKLWQVAIAMILVLLLCIGGVFYFLYARGTHTTMTPQTQHTVTNSSQLEIDPHKQLTNAQAELSQAKTVQQKATAYNDIGTAYLNNQQPDQAITAYQSALSVDSANQVPALTALANAYITAGQKDQAISTLQKLVAELQKSSDPMLQSQAGRYQQVITQLQNGGTQ